MTKTIWKWSPKPHEIAVVYGAAAAAYDDGVTDLETLEGLGRVRFFKFITVSELNAFIQGLEEAQEHELVRAVDVLTNRR